MKALVLGGNGFIGSHLVDSLLSAGHSVRVFDRLPEKYRTPLPHVEYHMGHITDAFAVAEALAGVDVVYHLVTTTLPATSNLDPAADVRDNLVSTIVLLEQMVKAGVTKIVYLSSGGTVYGKPQRLPVAEDHRLNPICSYGIVKVAVEKYLFMFEQLYGLKPVVLRPSNPFGPRQGHLGVQGVVATYLNNVVHDRPVSVWGDGSVVRDYLYVTDLAQLCLLAGESGKTGIFNVGYGAGFSLNEIIDAINQVTGKPLQVHFEPGRSFDVKEIVLDIARSKETFGWSPQVPLQDGIKRHWAWMQTIS